MRKINTLKDQERIIGNYEYITDKGNSVLTKTSQRIKFIGHVSLNK